MPKSYLPKVDLCGAKRDQPLERRLALLEDVEAIRNLKAQYAYYLDGGYDREGFGRLFTEDCLWEADYFGTYQGVTALQDFMEAAGQQIKWAVHYMHNPLIEVAPDGETARARWSLLELATMVRPDDPARRDPVVISGYYEDTMVKEDGQWKFKVMKVVVHFVSDLAAGWVQQRFRPHLNW
jgi:hypothetical protein